MQGVSAVAASLWAKSDRGQSDGIAGPLWLPLYVHMTDSLYTCEHLWDGWVPQGTKDIIIADCNGDARLARSLVTFLAGIHDLGKASPEFQSQTWGSGEEGNLMWKLRDTGLPFIGDSRVQSKGEQWLGHPVIGDRLLVDYLSKYGWKLKKARFLGGILAAHHGKIPIPHTPRAQTDGSLKQVKRWDIRCGFYNSNPGKAGKFNKDNAKNKAWQSVQFELIDYVRTLAHLDDDDLNYLRDLHIHDEPTTLLSTESQSLITGIVIMSDWIASNTLYFPLIPARPYDCDEDSGRGAALLYECSLIETSEGLRKRADRAWRKLGLPPSWKENAMPQTDEELFAERFSFPAHAQPRPVQRIATDIARNVKDPGIMIIEAPMGEGKTEAALAVAEIFAHKAERGGVCVALPTMATTDAMFERVSAWVNRLGQDTESSANERTMFLAHGKAWLNKTYAEMMRANRFQDIGMDLDNNAVGTGGAAINATQQAVVNDWFSGRKRGILANFLVCTVDQVLMAALRMKHVMLRQLGLTNKVVIIDECHAYDAYMQQYLQRALEWLGGCHAPVILLSATLSDKLRNTLASAYLRGAAYSDSQTDNLPVLDKNAYPVITYTDGLTVQSCTADPSGRKTAVECAVIDDDVSATVRTLRERLADGGCAGVICDTVGRAQNMYEALKGVFGKECVMLSHSRFVDCDRMNNEAGLRQKLGPKATRANGERPGKYIVVGTQVLEQSLDIDFDVLVTDIAPIDLVMQRLGRVHRHHRGDGECDRPERLRIARCYIRGIDRWGETGPVFPKALTMVYEQASLKEALETLGYYGVSAHSTVHLPDDIAPLVRSAYEDDDTTRIEELHVPQSWREEYLKDCDERRRTIGSKEAKAQGYLLQDPVIQNSSGEPWEDGGAVQKGDAANNEEEKGQMTVRDTRDTVEVLLVRRCGDHLALLPWVMEGRELPIGEVPPDDVSVKLIQCAIRLPLSVCSDVDALIGELEDRCEEYVRNWQDSAWLGGRLLLVMDQEDNESFGCALTSKHVRYSRETGLSVENDEKREHDKLI